jgi:hypothetical protein
MLAWLWSTIVEWCVALLLGALEPPVNDPPEPDAAPHTPDPALDAARPAGLSEPHRVGMLIPSMFLRADAPEEGAMSDTSFLSQLEQRTQQVKITLANLEAERTRIEGLIARLQPLVPHYDNLLDAERALHEAQITLEPPARASMADNRWGFQEKPSQE